MSEQRHRTIAEVFRRRPFSEFPQQHRTGGSLPIAFIKTELKARRITGPAVSEQAIGVALRSDLTARWDFGCGWTKPKRLRTGDLVLFPPETGIRYEADDSCQILVVSVPLSPLNQLLEANGLSRSDAFAPLYEKAKFRDETVRMTAQSMWVESARYDGASSLMVDGLFQTLLAQLLRRVQRPLPALSGHLSAGDMARLDEYVQVRLNARLSIAELAGLFDLPEYVFARSFKATTGRTPHQYVLEQRIALAREMLSLGDEPIAAIAHACGFASQSHMTDVFRQKLGITPGRYRHEVRR